MNFEHHSNSVNESTQVQTSNLWKDKLRPDAKFTVCCMQNGLCADKRCDHTNAA
ncbi:hypothetical protein Pmar_PMAR019943, partial [Perkinsus marinus ATCC 50983]